MQFKLKILTLVSLILCSSSSQGIDREILESKKCSGMFSYFEKRHNLPKDILHSISLQESRKPHSKHKIGVVWPWTINVEGKGYHFKTKKEAIKFVKEEMRDGKTSIDIGCMQINLKHHPDAFTSLDQAFSPIKNIAYAAQLLRNHYTRLGCWNKAIGEYHSKTGDRAKNYQDSVIKINNKMMSYKQDLKRYSSISNFRDRLYSSNIYDNVRSLYENRGRAEIQISRMKSKNLFRKYDQ